MIITSGAENTQNALYYMLIAIRRSDLIHQLITSVARKGRGKAANHFNEYQNCDGIAVDQFWSTLQFH